MKKQLLNIMVAALVVFGASNSLMAQGLTTASVSGKVLDEGGQGLPGVNIVAIHEPSGTKYGASSTSNGTFQIRNMKIGGPYSFESSFVGYENQRTENVYLKLGESFPLQIQMSTSLTELMTIEITAESGVINSDRTGAQTSVNSEAIRNMPTIARSQQDLTRLTPQSDGNSFGGRNSLYNNFSLDGSIFNNSFGLDVATPGGQADANPVSIDAIEQMQVSLAPFDVRQGGFTGAGINAVTKSGSNEIKGTVYTFIRNEGMSGSNVDGVDAPNLDFSSNITGLSIGGPIIKNKLFFFVNAEAVRKTELAHGFTALKADNAGLPNTTSVPEADIQAVQQHLLNEWGYDAGAYENYTHDTYNNKFLAKIDWNLSDKHTLMMRYNFLDSYKDILPHPEAIIGRGPTSFRLPFENSSYRIFNKINSYVAELNSNFSSNISNKLMVSYTEFRDHRKPKSAPFPVVDIFNANGQLAISSGSEMFSTNNVLDQNVFQFTDNLTWFQNDHTWTFGVNYEQFKFDNSFNLFYYPWYTYDLASFLAADVAGGTDYNADVAASQQNPFTLSSIKVAQLGLYGQDEWQMNERFKLTLGLRVDVPLYLSDIAPDADIQNFTGWVNPDQTPAVVDPSTFPKTNLMWSPRVGFNWDAKGDRSLQVRGGTGIFTGRIPFVWLGNQASNAVLNTDPAGSYTFQVNDTHQDFKYPQVWKTNLGIDKRFDNGLVATFEGIYGKDINAVVHRNYDMTAPAGNLTGTGDTRAMFNGVGDQTRIFAASTGFVDFLDAGAIVMENAKEGFQMSLTGGLSKTFTNGFFVSAFYTYQNSKDLTSIPAEIAADAFQRNPVVGNPNGSSYSWSRYGLTHRFIASLGYEVSYSKFTSSFSGFFEFGKGGRYSYTYAGDINLDGVPANNDLLYVPSNSGDINFGTYDSFTDVLTPATPAEHDAQYNALSAYIDQDPYLSTRRGDYAERHGAQLPGFGQFDFKFVESFNFEIAGKPNQLQLSFDILNIGNMISSSWGVRQFANNTSPISVSTVDASGTPWLSFDPSLTESYINDTSLRSKWQMQIGVRWIFNGL